MVNPFERDDKGEVFINLGSYGGKVSIAKLLGVDCDSFKDMLSEQPDLYFKASRLLANLNAERKTKKFEKEVYISNLYLHFKNEEGKITEKNLEAKIMMDGGCQKLTKSIIECERIYDIVAGLVKAMEQKKDVLIAHSSNYREELRQQVLSTVNKIEKEV